MRDLWPSTFRVGYMRMRSLARLRVHKKIVLKEKEMSVGHRTRRNAFYSSSYSPRDTKNVKYVV